MSDNKSRLLTVELITKCMEEESQEIGIIVLDDPKLPTTLNEFSQLLQLRRAITLSWQ